MRLSTLFWVCVILAAGFALFQVKYVVRDKKAQVASIEKQLETQRTAIHVLEAEWSYLNRPERLATLNQRYLSLRAASARQVVYQDALQELENNEIEFASDSLPEEGMDAAEPMVRAVSYLPDVQ